jgi:cation transport ATPase
MSLACVGRVERALSAVPGVAEARVNFATERATLRLARRDAEAREWRWRWIVGAVLSAPVVTIEMGAHWFGHAVHFTGADVVVFVLATLVVALLGGRFGLNAVRGLRHGQFTMDSHIAPGRVRGCATAPPPSRCSGERRGQAGGNASLPWAVLVRGVVAVSGPRRPG